MGFKVKRVGVLFFGLILSTVLIMQPAVRAWAPPDGRHFSECQNRATVKEKAIYFSGVKKGYVRVDRCYMDGYNFYFARVSNTSSQSTNTAVIIERTTNPKNWMSARGRYSATTNMLTDYRYLDSFTYKYSGQITINGVTRSAGGEFTRYY